MSFFDDDDEPIRVTRTRPAAPRASGARGAAAVDEATVRQRRLVALGIAVVVLVVLVLVVRSCQQSATRGALEDYNSEVSSLVTDSKRSVAEPLFSALDAGGEGQDLQVQVNQLRVTAQDQADRAAALDAPGQMARAQDDLELVLNLRVQALASIGEQLPSALVTGRSDAQTAEDAVNRIAGDMQLLLTSDVVYAQRVAPYVKQALDEAEVTGQRIPGTEVRTLTNFGWLVPDQVAGRFGSPRTGGGTGASSEPAPGTHGHGLTSVTAGGVALEPGGAVNNVPAASDLTFDVAFANQGENAETDVQVVVRVRAGGGGGTPISVTRTVDRTEPGTDATVSIPLGRTPPTGTAEIRVSVNRVPGEETADNNVETYTAIFQR